MVIKLMKTFVRFVKYLIFTYCITGLVYSAAGYVYREVVGKQEVFSPLISVPSTVLSWPWMVYADLKHIGVGLQDIMAFISLVVCLVVVITKELNLKKNIKKDLNLLVK